jgi:hypothetical protein
MGSSSSKEQQPPSPLNPSNKREERHSKAFIDIPDEIILYILDFLDYFDGTNVLKQVNNHFHEIIESKWPSIPRYLFKFWPTPARPSILQTLFKSLSNTNIECTLKRDFYQFCMTLNKEKVIHNYDPSNYNMKQARYLVAIMNEYLLSHHEVNPSQWDVIMLKDEKCNIAFTIPWTDYLKLCHNLVYLTLDNASHINLILKHTKLEGLFLGCGAYVDPPSSMKIFVFYTSKVKFREYQIQFSSFTQFLRLQAPGYWSSAPKPCTELEIW